MTERLQKIIAQAGLCSRRTGEDLLRQGRVTVNGRRVALGASADPLVDHIEVDGEPLPAPPRSVYLMLHKPRGYVTTLSDERGRPTAAQLVAQCPQRVFPVGRLDMDSEGLLIFTNDGALMQTMIHPSHEIDKVYHVTASGDLANAVSRLASITDLDGERIRPAQVNLRSCADGQADLEITIHEGKNRQIRRMCRQAGLRVLRLVRVQEGNLTLGDLPVGRWRYLTDIEIKGLKGCD